MKKLFLVTLVSLFWFSEIVAQTVVADKVIAVVGNSAILYSDVVDYSKQVLAQRKERGYTSDRDAMSEALEALLTQKLLYNQALIDSIEINLSAVSESVDDRVEAMIADAGSIAALEAREGKPVFEIKSDMRRMAEEGQYAQSMQQTIMGGVTITPGEVEKFYNSLRTDMLPIIPEQYVYAQISKFPTSITQAKQRTRERLLEMRERVINGSRFDMLARMYSMDPGSALQGGEMDYMPLSNLEKPFAEALAQLQQPNQMSGVVETVYGYHIIQLIDKKGDEYKCRHILLRPTFTDYELADDLKMLDSLRTEIAEGRLTFEKAALDYSDDKYSKQNGGLVTNHELLEVYGANDTSYSRTAFYKEDLGRDYTYMRGLKPGDMSAPFQSQDMRGNTLTKLIKLIEIIPAHTASLANDYLQIEQIALQDKQQREFEKWLNEKVEAMYVRIDPSMDTSEFENKKWIK
ncbi:MAG: peptidylprolyl isomerase [Tidjanibacter sp.]|nr:peptidylprolyl isomerase [Tidjanibacter sp.]